MFFHEGNRGRIEDHLVPLSYVEGRGAKALWITPLCSGDFLSSDVSARIPSSQSPTL